MAKIFVEKKEIKSRVKEEIESTSFDIVDGNYVEDTKLTRRYISDIYSYLDFSVLFSMENLFDEYYTKIVLFNDEKKVGYNLISLSSNLDISLKRLSSKNFLILGINRDQEIQGQASFCSLQDDGSVNDVTINFNHINQYKVIEQKYFLLNFIEILPDTTTDEMGETIDVKKYINTIAIYRDDGSILRVLIEESLNIKRELVCDIEGDKLLIYYKDDGSILKKMTLSEIMLTTNSDNDSDDSDSDGKPSDDDFGGSIDLSKIGDDIEDDETSNTSGDDKDSDGDADGGSEN